MNSSQVLEYIQTIKQKIVDHRLVGVTVLAGFFLVAVLIVVTGPSSEPMARSEKAWPVSIEVADPKMIAPTLLAFGRVESQQMANLKTSISAPVGEMLASEGDWVEKGDAIIQLRDEEQRLALRMAEAEHASRQAQLESARTEFELAQSITAHQEELKAIADAKLKRHLDLYSNNMVSNALVDEVRREASERAIALERHYTDLKLLPRVIDQRAAAVSEAEALVEKARIDLAQTQISAPFNGRVIKTLVAPGDRSVPGAPLAVVANYDNLEIRASIPADLGHKLRGQLEHGVTVVATGELDGREIHLTLVRLSGDVKAGQSGIDAFFVADEVLDIGRVVNLHITLPVEIDVVALPVQSIYERGRIYRVDDNRLEGIDIEQVGDYIDETGEHRILVRSEKLQPGDKLITTQLPRAITGLLVDPIGSTDLDQALASKNPEKKGS